jgi:hypothetical protein
MKFYFACALTVLLLSINANAQKIYHCENADGTKSFQEKPCKATTLKVEDAPKGNSAGDGKKRNSGNDFYGMPVHPSATKKEVTDDATIGIASMRYISTISSTEMLMFYREKIPLKHKEETLGDTVILTYRTNDLNNKMITIVNYFGKADVTIQTEK